MPFILQPSAYGDSLPTSLNIARIRLDGITAPMRNLWQDRALLFARDWYDECMTTANALAHPNIAFIKYWGNRDDDLRIPENGSISLTLNGLETRTTVEFNPNLDHDEVRINGQPPTSEASYRITTHLDRIRSLVGSTSGARVFSANSFPTGTGIASSASAFAALTVAGCAAAGLDLDRTQLSRLARKGSGSAARSIFGGYVELMTGSADEESFAQQIAPADHWALIDIVAVIATSHKPTGSTPGHALAATSPLQAARVADAPRRLEICRKAIADRDFDKLAKISELDSNLMHAVMMTSAPPLQYWLAGTIDVMRKVTELRADGTPVFYTIDAGPNVHCICETQVREAVAKAIEVLPAVQYTIPASAGPAARLIR